MWNNVTYRADSKQMWVVDGKQRIYLEWPKGRIVPQVLYNSAGRWYKGIKLVVL